MSIDIECDIMKRWWFCPESLSAGLVDSHMMTFTTIIPTQRNDGTPVRKRELTEIRTRLIAQFGGATFEGMVEGYWIDDADGRQYRDPGIKVTVGCDRERLQDAVEAVKAIGKQLGQQAMWFEVRYYDGPQILRIE